MKVYLKITFSALLTAIAVNFFLMHDGLAPGGITGMALLLSSLFKMNVETMSLMISIPMLVIAVLLLGKSFGLKTLYITLLTPIFMKFLPHIWVTEGLFLIHPILEFAVSALIAGMLIGVGIGIALNAGCATGGTDVLALIIHNFLKRFDVETIIFILDGIVIIGTGFVNQNFFASIFSFISLIVINRTIKYITHLH